MIRQHGHIAFACAKWRQRDDFKRQPVEQIRTETPLFDKPRQMLVGRRDDTDINLQRLVCADPRHFAIFDRAQQAFLRTRRQGCELVKKQRPAVGFLEPPLARLGRAGKRPRFMPKQLGLDQCFGQRRAVHRDQWPGPTRAQAMQAFGNQLLAGSPLADHQHGPVQCRCTARALDAVQKGIRLPDNLL